MLIRKCPSRNGFKFQAKYFPAWIASAPDRGMELATQSVFCQIKKEDKQNEYSQKIDSADDHFVPVRRTDVRPANNGQDLWRCAA
jgi:hypothetical protein